MFFINKKGEIEEIPKYSYINDNEYYTYVWKNKYNIDFQEYSEESNDNKNDYKDQKQQILNDILN